MTHSTTDVRLSSSAQLCLAQLSSAQISTAQLSSALSTLCIYSLLLLFSQLLILAFSILFLCIITFIEKFGFSSHDLVYPCLHLFLPGMVILRGSAAGCRVSKEWQHPVPTLLVPSQPLGQRRREWKICGRMKSNSLFGSHQVLGFLSFTLDVLFLGSLLINFTGPDARRPNPVPWITRNFSHVQSWGILFFLQLTMLFLFFSVGAVVNDSAEEIDVWCKPGGYVLSTTHKQRVLDQVKNGWVDDG